MMEIGLGVTTGTPLENDRPLVGRLIEAFLRANETACYSDDSQWGIFRRMQESVADAVRARDIAAVSNILRRPHEGYLMYGFEDLGVWSVEAYKLPERRAGYAAHCYELLLQLGRATGVLAVPNPEAPDREISVPELPILLDRVEAALGFSIRPPEPYPHYCGLETDRGVLGTRVLNALYCAWRIRQLTAGVSSPRILEVGAGIGRLAEYTHRMGLTDYWIVDVPMTSLVQGHFLACALGEDRVVLDGEPDGNVRSDAVKILNPERFFANENLRFDLVINTDSLTELGRDVATRYFRRAADRSPVLFSVNHEVNPYRVIDLHQELCVFGAVDRRPYWMRNGYVEEVFTHARRNR
jgi:hypothetical protein